MLTTINAANHAATSGKLYDLCMIEKLCRGNMTQVKQMVNVFISRIPSSVEDIKEAFKRKDGAAIKKTAHQIKPVLGMYAVVTLEQDIKEIEEMGKTETLTPVLSEKIEKVDTVVKQIVQQMQATILEQQ